MLYRCGPIFQFEMFCIASFTQTSKTSHDVEQLEPDSVFVSLPLKISHCPPSVAMRPPTSGIWCLAGSMLLPMHV